MKKFYYLALAALLAIVCNGCSIIGGNVPGYEVKDIHGLWLENGTQHYVRFTSEQSDEIDYLYGREWDEAEDVYEEDLKLHGDGWFKYKFQMNGVLVEIHLMDNGGADIPKIYTVTKLTSTELEFYEEEQKSNTFSFSKVVEKK